MLQAGNKESFNPYMAALQEVLQLNVAYVRGEGTRLFDAQGRIYLDFVAGFGSVPFGHNPPALNQALVAFAQTGEPSMVQVSAMPAAQTLTNKLLSFMPQELDTVWFCNSGTEAVEAAIKAARAATGCYRIISARNGFHGKTLGALAATHRRKYQEPFLTAESVDEAFVQVDFGDIASLNQALEQHAGKVAAILLEPVQGEGGAVVPPAGYLRAVRTLCDQHKVILILDEIQTGFWRTGPRFAAEAEQVVPDIMVLAKALGGGLVPIGACVMKRSVYSEEFGMKHSSTFGGNGLCARIAYTALEEFERQQTLLEQNVNDRAQQLYAAHRSLLQRFPRVVRGISGRGLLQGVHLALDREQTRQRRGNILCVLSEQEKLIPLVCSYLLNVHSIRLAPALNKGQVLRVEPPLTVSEAECEVYIAALTRAVELLNAGNTAALCAHFVGLSDADIQQEGGTATPSVDARDFSPQGDDASLEKIAFLLHPIDYKSFIDFDQSLASFDRRQLQALSQMLATNIEPFLYGADRITTRNGAAVYCEFISLSHTAESLIEMGSKAAEMEVAKAVDLARSRGVRLVGLGGFTSVVTQGGRKVLDRGVAITSGNSFTVVSAIDAVQMACRQLGKSLVDCRVAVVGAGGSIGSAVVRLLLPQVKQLVLVGNQANAGKSLRRITTSVTGALERYLCGHNNAMALAATLVSCALEHGLDGRDRAALAACVEDWLKRGCHDGLQFTMDLESGLSNADIVVCATSATGDLIYPDFLKHAAVVCDMSRPSNTSHRIREERPDVLVIDGGVVEIPNKLDIDTYFGFPQGIIYACMAETIMLGLAGKFDNTSIGHQLDAETLDYLRDAAKDFGFKLARLRSFDRPLTSRDWLHIKKFHKLEAVAHSVPATAPSAYSPAAASSLTECALVNVVQLLLDRHVARNGSKTAVMVDGGSITYAKLWRKSCQVAHALRQRKLQAGDRVSIIAYDCLETVIVMLAVQRLGMAAVIHNPFYQSEELKAAIASAAPNLVLVSERCEQHQQLLNLDNGPCGCLELFVQQASVDFADMEPPSPCMVPAGTAAVCHFTSGTTGSPSLVVHSHRDIINTNVGYAEKVLGLTESDVTFTASRLFFAYGYNSLHMALFRGATSILVPAQAKAPILHEIIACQKPTVFFGVPTVYLLLLRYHTQTADLSSVRLFVSAGEPLSEDIYFAWKMRFGREVIDGIGCTESLSTYISNRPGATLAGATGRIVPGFEIKILNDTGQLAKRGEIGILWLRGNTLAKSINADANGWFCTNDMVAMDEQGIVFYVGRANDILKVGGCWVSPMVIEQAVMQHPQVADCAVVEKVEMGALTRPVVYVVPADVSIMWDRQFATRLKQFCIDRLPPQHYPHFVEFIDAIPRTVNGKVQRFKLRNLQMSQYAALAGF